MFTQRRLSDRLPGFLASGGLVFACTLLMPICAGAVDGIDQIELPVVCRSDWKAAEPRAGLKRHKIRMITIHHSATVQRKNENFSRRVRGFQSWHQNHLKFPDIAYHFLIDSQGVVHQGRDPSFKVDTPTDYDPDGHLSICLIGNFEVEQPDPRQLQSLYRLISWAGERYGVSLDHVKGHRDYAHTLCPGKNVYKLIHTGFLDKRLRDTQAGRRFRLKYSCTTSDSPVSEP